MEVVLRSRTGASLMADGMQIRRDNISLYKAEPEQTKELQNRLDKAGFEVLAASQFSVSITGPLQLCEKYFQVRILQRDFTLPESGNTGRKSLVSFMVNKPQMPMDIADLAETAVIPRAGYLLEGEGPMPDPDYYHLNPPEDVVRLTNSVLAHELGYRGEGIRVAMIDTGFFGSHDYYADKGYNVTVHAPFFGAPEEDLGGHGTAIAANLLAIAPECEFHFYKALDIAVEETGFWYLIPSIRRAVEDGCEVISCSFGLFHDPVTDSLLTAEIIDAVENGVTVAVSGGNINPPTHDPSWPGCLPEVVSVGGAYPLPEGGWEASSYAASGINPVCPDRRCPDLCGIVGHGPSGILIVSPTMSGSHQDGSFAGGAFPVYDETNSDDGWMVASGTSGAAPMVAGAAALMLQARPSLTPDDIKRVLRATCTDVRTGISASGHAADRGIDMATGAGIINIGLAVRVCALPGGCPLSPGMTANIPFCRVAPTPSNEHLVCPEAPHIVQEVCFRAPVPPCVVAPMIIASPDDQCVSGPYLGYLSQPIRPGNNESDDKKLLPAVVMLDEEELKSLLEKKSFTSSVNPTIGLADEYCDFPAIEKSKKRKKIKKKKAFNPKVKSIIEDAD